MGTEYEYVRTSHGSVHWFALLVVFYLFSFVLALSPKCPPKTFKPDCANCTCDWSSATGCDSENGKCRCKDGFKGKDCTEDVNECFYHPGICDKKVCRNKIGSYECVPCPIGFSSHRGGECVPCPGFTYGDGCEEDCRCVQDNTLYCMSSTGECICKEGWQGADCRQSVDDCIGNDCPDGTCEDRHLHYVCICGDNFMVIGNTCEQYKAVFISLERRIAIGQWVDIYMFFSLPDKYFKATHQAPELRIKITDDQSDELCWADFKKQSQDVKGNEPILSKIGVSVKKPFQRFLHLKRRFRKHALTVVTADVPSLDRKWELVFNVRYKSKVVQSCLENMTIAGVEMNDISKAGTNPIKRQSYYVFEVKFPQSDDCFESPRVAWNYYTLTMNEDSQLCLTSKSIEPLDTDQLARENMEIPLSDHQQYKEILTKNTLPLGLFMICVMAYVERSVNTKVIACGFFTVEPSYKIVGSIYPSGTYMTINKYHRLTIRASYRELDLNATLTYTWKCRFKMDKYTDPILKRTCTKGGFKRDWLRIQRSRDFSYPGTYKMELEARVEDLPQHFYTKIFTFKIVDDLKVTTVYIVCESECADRISGKKPVKLTALGPEFHSFEEFPTKSAGMSVNLDRHDPTFCIGGKWTLCKWKVEMRKITGSKTPTFFVETTSRGRSKHPLAFDITSKLLKRTDGKLPLGHRFKVYADCKAQISGSTYYTQGRAIYSFETVRAPVGDGCQVSPKFGRAVFTRFNVTCVGYKDVEAGLPLVYKLYQNKLEGAEDDTPILVGYSNQGEFPPITLSIESTGSAGVPLRVAITTVFQTTTTFDLEIVLMTEDQKKVIDNTLSERKSISTLGSQEELRLIKDVATVMRASASAAKGAKTTVRKQLMKNMKDFQSVAADSIEHSSSALKELTARDDEVDKHSLSDGLQVADRVSKYLGKVGGGDFSIVKDVATLQVSAMNSLVKASSSIGKMPNVTDQEKQVIATQGKEDSKRTISSMSQITKTLRSGFDISKDPIKIKEDTIEVILQSTNVSNISVVEMKSDNDAVGFSISPRALNYMGNGTVETEFEFYNKSPYSWTSDRVQGDIPVMKVNFVEPLVGDSGKNETKVKRKVWQFSKPADVFLQHRENKTDEGAEHSMLILVDKHTHEIYMSSCVYLSILASTEEVTILELSSPENLIFKTKARYTNSISALELLTEYDMIDLPLNTPSDAFRTIIEGRNLTRNNNFLILPKLTKNQYKPDTPFFHVKISIKREQKFKDVKTMEPLSEETLKTVLDKNDIEANVEALYLYNLTVKALYQKLSCVHFDEEKLDYSYDACELSVFTSKEELHCRCVVAAAFSASFFVMPRLIDPTNIHLFTETFENPLTVSLVIFLWLSFMALFIWGRRKDRDDEIKRGATVLTDNKDQDTYVYLLCVVTGNSALARTTSNVYMFMNGTWGSSEVHILKDTSRALFTSGAENWFVLTTPNDLGYLKSAVIWTDYSGGNPSWFLYNIHVQNVQTGEAWNLKYNSWLSASKGTGQIIVEIPAVEENIYKEGWFSKITGKGRVDIRNEHLWFGMVFKTAYNKFTRLRRLATAFSMLQALMLLNLMFYGVKNLDDSRQFQYIFGQRVHVTSVIIGVQSCVIMTLFGMGLAGFFNRIVPKPRPEAQKTEDTLAMEEHFAKKRTALTLDALQTFVSHDTSDRRAEYLLGMFRNPEAVEEEECKVPEKVPESDLWFTFPWWFIYFYWVFIVVYNVFASFYTMLYGLSLGYEKSINWVVSFFSGFLFDLIVSQPIKVMGTVLVLVIIYRQTYSLRDMAPFTNVVDASNAVKKEMERSRSYVTSKSRSGHHRPPNTLQIKEIVARLSIEFTAREMLRDLLLYSIFLAALVSMTIRHSHVQASFMQTTALNKIIFNADVTEDGEETNVLDDISTVQDIWTFFNDHLLPFLVKSSDDKIDLNSFYFVGTARVRQVRVERDETGCDTITGSLMEVYQRERCALSMSDGKEERRNFNHSWYEPIEYDKDDIDKTDDDDDDDDDDNTGSSMFRYTTAKELKTTPITAPRATYPGGGYTLTLPRHDIAESSVIIKRLANSGWLDHLTRCLFVEFTLYNPDSHLFTYVVTGFEFDEMGGPYPFKTVMSARLYHYGRSRQWTRMTELTVMVCSAFYTVIVGKCFLRVGPTEFVTNFWNWVDTAILVLLYILAVFIFLRDAMMFSVLNVFAQYGNNRFLDFQAVFHRDFIVAVIEGCVGATGFLKLIYVLRFNPFSKTFMKSADVAKEDVFGFTVLTALFMFGFSLFAMTIFGKDMDGYTNIPHCLLSLLFFIMGEAEYPSLVATDRILGPAYFLVVMMVTQYIILNFFLSMIRDGLDMAMAMEYGKKEATFTYMMDTLKLYFGIGSNRQIKDTMQVK